MFGVIVMLEDKMATQTYFCSRLLEIFLQDFLILLFHQDSVYFYKNASSKSTKATPEHDVATTILRCRDGVLGVVSLFFFPRKEDTLLWPKSPSLVSSDRLTCFQ